VNVTPEKLAAIKAGAETALDAVHRGWPWPEIDNDLVIGAALKNVPALVAEVERLRTAILDISVEWLGTRNWPMVVRERVIGEAIERARLASGLPPAEPAH
jgi:hypothetical protein